MNLLFSLPVQGTSDKAGEGGVGIEAGEMAWGGWKGMAWRGVEWQFFF